MADGDYRVIFNLGLSPHSSFEWWGRGLSPQAAELEAGAALLSVLQAVISTDEAAAVRLASRVRTQLLHDVYDHDWPLPCQLCWRISHYGEILALNPGQSTRKEISKESYFSVIRNIVFSDNNVIESTDADAIVVIFLDDKNVYYERNISVDIYRDVGNFSSHAMQLHDSSIFALMTLAAAFDIGNMDNYLPSSSYLEIAESATLRAVERAKANGRAADAVAFFEELGADLAAQRLLARDGIRS